MVTIDSFNHIKKSSSWANEFQSCKNKLDDEIRSPQWNMTFGSVFQEGDNISSFCGFGGTIFRHMFRCLL